MNDRGVGKDRLGRGQNGGQLLDDQGRRARGISTLGGLELDLNRALIAEGLDLDIAKLEIIEGRADQGRVDRLAGRGHIHHRAALEVDAERQALGEAQGQGADDGDDRQEAHQAGDAHKVQVRLVRQEADQRPTQHEFDLSLRQGSKESAGTWA